MKTLYFDCSMGAAGDMLAAALLELHPDPEAFLQKLNAALPAGVTAWAERDEKRGVAGTHFHVDVHGEEEGHEDGHHHHPHSSVAEILGRIDALEAPEQVKQDAAAVYRRIAEAESAVHGEPVENIHLHEVGSLDALADVLAVCWLMHELQPEKIVCSPIAVGSGTVKCAHGVLPVPARYRAAAAGPVHLGRDREGRALHPHRRGAAGILCPGLWPGSCHDPG